MQVLGTPIPTIMNTEDRERFNAEINSIGERVAPSKAATNLEGAIAAAEEVIQCYDFLIWKFSGFLSGE